MKTQVGTPNYEQHNYTESEIAAFEAEPVACVTEPDYEGTVSSPPELPPEEDGGGDEAYTVALPRHMQAWLSESFTDLEACVADLSRWDDDGGTVWQPSGDGEG